eukprot:6303940-Pyramimonas_sp.AAC.1
MQKGGGVAPTDGVDWVVCRRRRMGQKEPPGSSHLTKCGGAGLQGQVRARLQITAKVTCSTLINFSHSAEAV